MITALGGGVGAAKFLSGLVNQIGNEHLTVIVNTADDITIGGLRISPDIDTIIYTLSGKVDSKRRWGINNDTYNCLSALKRFGVKSWFNLGDKDLATHLYRTHLRSNGYTLTQITSKISEAFGLDGMSIIPMTNEDVETWIETDEREIHFQKYLIKEKMLPPVKNIKIKGIEKATPSPGVIDSIINSHTIIVCPSNPIISIGPILSVQGIRDALKITGANIIAVSPIVGGIALKGPADKLMRASGIDVTPVGIAKLYKDFLDELIIDKIDKKYLSDIEELGIKCRALDTIMHNIKQAEELANCILTRK